MKIFNTFIGLCIATGVIALAIAALLGLLVVMFH